MTRALCLSFSLMLLGLGFGCGGGDEPGAAGACGKVQPCGGDLVGSWDIVADCLNDAVVTMAFAPLAARCPQVTGRANGMASGSVTFGADRAYSISATFSGTLDLRIPASCGGGTCADLDAGLRSAFAADPPEGFSGVACSGTGTCLCQLFVAPTRAVEAGTYATSGSSLTLSPQTGAVDQAAYCIVGDTGHLMTLTMPVNMGSMGTAIIEEDMMIVRKR